MSQPILRVRIPYGKKLAQVLSLLLVAFSLSLNEKTANAQVDGPRAPSLEIQRINQLDRDIDKRIDERFGVVHAFLIFISITITLPVFFLLFASGRSSKKHKIVYSRLQDLDTKILTINSKCDSLSKLNQAYYQAQLNSLPAFASLDPQDIKGLAELISMLVLSQLDHTLHEDEDSSPQSINQAPTQAIAQAHPPATFQVEWQEESQNAQSNVHQVVATEAGLLAEPSSHDAITERYLFALTQKDKQLLKQLTVLELKISDESEEKLMNGTAHKTQLHEVPAGSGSYLLIQSESTEYLLYPSLRTLESFTSMQTKKGVYTYRTARLSAATVQKPAETTMISDGVWEVDHEGIILVPSMID
jgi:hypothetical protein